MARNNQEVRLHIVILQYLQAVLPPIAAETLIHIRNEGKRTREAQRLAKAMGLRAGTEDLAFIWHGRLHALEVKCEGSYQSPAQKAREKALKAAGARYAICRSTEDVAEVLAGWAIPTRDCSWRRPQPAEART